MNKHISALVFSFVTTLVVFSQNGMPVVYQGLLSRGAEKALTQESNTYFISKVNELSVNSENIELSGCYKIVFFPINENQVGLRINEKEDKYQFMFFALERGDGNKEIENHMSYRKMSASQFYLKNGYMLYVTTDGVYGTSVLPDGTIDSIFYLDPIRQ